MGNMTHRILTGDGDWTFGHGLSDIAIDLDAIALNITAKLREWKGNCFFNLDAAIDWRPAEPSTSPGNLSRTDV